MTERPPATPDGEPTSPSPTTPVTEPDSPTPTAPAPPRTAPRSDPLRGSRTSGIWAGIVGLGLVLVLLIIFITQNTQVVSVAFLGWDGQAPLAVMLLIAAVGGLFVTAAAGTLRILQLRRRVRRDHKRR